MNKPPKTIVILSKIENYVDKVILSLKTYKFDDILVEMKRN